MRWLLGHLLLPLLRAHFYCTESEAYRQEVFYYRCPLCLEPHRVSHINSFYLHGRDLRLDH